MPQYRTLVSLEKTPPEEVSKKVAELEADGWQFERRLPDHWVAEFARDFDDHDSALAAGTDVQRIMAEYYVPEDELAVDRTVGRHLGPTHTYLVGPNVGPDLIAKVISQGGSVIAGVPDKGVLLTPPASGVNQTQDAGKSKQKADQSAATEAPANGASPAAVARGETADLAHEGLLALGVPTKAWDYLGKEARRDLAQEVLERFYASRLAYGRSVAWTFAPLYELLERAPEDYRPQLAEEILRVREGLTTAQKELRQQDVELKKKDVELKGALLRQQGVATQMLDEVLKQMEKWRGLARLGAILLVITLVFSMAMTAWVIKLAGDKDINDWTLSTAIFALAVFAISPGVLLLLQRPLKGLDEWKPSGKADSAGTASSDDASKSKGSNDAKGATSASSTSK